MTVVRVERLLDNPAVAQITLDRPARRNSLVWETWEELGDVLTDIEDSDVAAVVLSGAGGYFSSGGDRDTSTAHGLRALAAVHGSSAPSGSSTSSGNCPSLWWRQ